MNEKNSSINQICIFLVKYYFMKENLILINLKNINVIFKTKLEPRFSTSVF